MRHAPLLSTRSVGSPNICCLLLLPSTLKQRPMHKVCENQSGKSISDLLLLFFLPSFLKRKKQGHNGNIVSFAACLDPIKLRGPTRQGSKPYLVKVNTVAHLLPTVICTLLSSPLPPPSLSLSPRPPSLFPILFLTSHFLSQPSLLNLLLFLKLDVTCE